MKQLPNFMIIGAQKAGTTTLHNILSQHPEVYMPKEKELNFYIKEKLFNKGIESYKAMFNPTNEIAIGEASPGYMCHPLVPKRIFESNKDVKLICVLRNPVDRAYSQYWDNKRHLTETESFKNTFSKYSHYQQYESGKIGYFTRGFYADYLERYYKYFPKENILLLKSEDLRNDFEESLIKCYKFLGLSDLKFKATKINSNESYIYNNILYKLFFNYDFINRIIPYKIKKFSFFGNTSKFSYPHMDRNLRNELTIYFLKHNKKLENLTNLNFSNWKLKKDN